MQLLNFVCRFFEGMAAIDDSWRDNALAGRLSRRASEAGTEITPGLGSRSSSFRRGPDARTASVSNSGAALGQQLLQSMTAKSVGSRGPSRAPSMSGRVTSSASQLALMSLDFMEDRADRLLVPDHIDRKARDEAKEVVLEVYMRVFGHTPEPAEMLHYVACLLQEEPLDKRGLVQQVLSSFNFKLHQRQQMARVPLAATLWRNRLHPWMAVEDEADEEVGTVKWVRNEERAEAKRWETGECKGGCLGGEVLYGKFFNSTKDAWTTAAVETGLRNGGGVYLWHLKKIQSSQCGNKARLGVMVRDCELDQNYRRSHLSNRAWFMDEDGEVYNGDTRVCSGAAFWNQNSVVSFRLDDATPGERELSVHVQYMQAESWEQQLASGAVPLPPACAVIRDLPPDRDLYPFIQDYYAGSGFELSEVTTLTVDERGRQQHAAIVSQAESLLCELCPPDEGDADSGRATPRDSGTQRQQPAAGE